MNSWERVIRALDIEMPDRVPIFEMHIPPKISSYILGKSEVLANNIQSCFEMLSRGYDAEKLNEFIAEELIELHLKAGLDFIRVPGGFIRGRDIVRLNEVTWEIDGKRYRYSAESIWELESRENEVEEKVREWLRMDSEARIDGMIFSILRNIVKKVKGKIFLTFDADGSWGPIVSDPKLLIKVLSWMHTKPDLVEALIRKMTLHAIGVGNIAIDEGADAILMCVDYGNKNGPWMSPKLFKRFVKPALKGQVDSFNKKGAYAILHSDGNIAAILRDVVDSGIDAYQGIDIEAGMSLRAVKEQYGDEICLIGNVDPRIIEFGTRDEVSKEVRRCLKEGAPGGGYILSASANISINTNAENFLLMLDYAKRIGRYPLNRAK